MQMAALNSSDTLGVMASHIVVLSSETNILCKNSDT